MHGRRANPTAMKRGIDKAVEAAVQEVKKLSKPVSGDMIAQVGSISANLAIPPSAASLWKP